MAEAVNKEAATIEERFMDGRGKNRGIPITLLTCGVLGIARSTLGVKYDRGPTRISTLFTPSRI